MSRLATCQRLVLVLAVLFALALLAPTPAAAVELPELPDLTPDIPGPADLVREMFEFLLKTFFGIKVGVTRRVVDFLIAHPVYSDTARYPELARLRAYVSAGGWAILSLTIAVSALRYWASGFTASGSYEAIQGVVRGAAAAAVGGVEDRDLDGAGAAVCVWRAGDRALAAAGDVVGGSHLATGAVRCALVAGGVGALLRAVRGAGSVRFQLQGRIRRRARQAVRDRGHVVGGVQGAPALGSPGDVGRDRPVAGQRAGAHDGLRARRARCGGARGR